MTEVTFTNNLSDAIAFAGTVKIKCDDIPEGGFVEIREERVDGEYEKAGEKDAAWSTFGHGARAKLLDLVGNYKVFRSHESITVGYEEA